MSAWTELAASRTFDIPGFRFDRGGCMDLHLHCRSLGSRSRSGANVVLMLHGTTGSGNQFLRPETGDFLFGPGQPLDITRYCILLPDAIGHGLSSKPSDGAGTEFPKYGYGDIVRAQHLLVTQHLGLNHLRLVLGTSMGGMQTWMWGQAYPRMMDALMPIASLPARLTGQNLLMRRIMIAMIKSDPGYHEGPSRGSRPVALGAAWNLFRLLVDSPARLAEVFSDVEAADEHVRAIAVRAMETEDPNDVTWEFEASRDYDPANQLKQIQAPLLAVNFADDELNPQNLNVLSRAILEVARGRAVTIPAGPLSRGHQTLQVAELWAHLVGEVLDASSATKGAKQ